MPFFCERPAILHGDATANSNRNCTADQGDLFLHEKGGKTFYIVKILSSNFKNFPSRGVEKDWNSAGETRATNPQE